MKYKVKEELDLIRAVLEGYPPSIAQADAMRAIRVIQEETDCGPLTTEEYPVPMGFSQYSTRGLQK
jgi:hypothetical protein